MRKGQIIVDRLAVKLTENKFSIIKIFQGCFLYLHDFFLSMSAISNVFCVHSMTASHDHLKLQIEKFIKPM